MTTMLERAERFLRKKRGDHLAKMVRYTQAGGIFTQIKATPAATTIDASDGLIAVRADVVDWLIDVREFQQFVGQCPRPGDTIEGESQDGDGVSDTKVYTVAGIAGEPCYRYHGRDMMTFRIHTKRTLSEFNPRDVQY